MRQLREQVAMAAPTHGRVLIYGENGTGKAGGGRSTLSRRRRPSSRSTARLEVIERVVRPVRGAFTGAVADLRQVRGRRRGTFLDEIGDMSLKTQAKVLRVCRTDDGGGRRDGADQGGRVCLRPPTRTSGRTPDDFGKTCTRLNVIPIFVPPLRSGRGHPLLADHFMADFAREYGQR
jgi:two-component system nitrogen regulation response regulator NtrX